MVRATRSFLLLLLIGSSFLANVVLVHGRKGSAKGDEHNEGHKGKDDHGNHKDEREVREEAHKEYLEILNKFKVELLEKIASQWRNHIMQRGKDLKDYLPGIFKTGNNNKDGHPNGQHGNHNHDPSNPNSFSPNQPSDKRTKTTNGLPHDQFSTSQHPHVETHHDRGDSNFIRQNGGFSNNPLGYRGSSSEHQLDGRIQKSESSDVSKLQQERLGYNKQFAHQIPSSSISHVCHYHEHILTIEGNRPNQQQQVQPADPQFNPRISQPVQTSSPPCTFIIQEIRQPSDQPYNSPTQQQFQTSNPPCNRPIQDTVQPSKPLYIHSTEQRVQPTDTPFNPNIHGPVQSSKAPCTFVIHEIVQPSDPPYNSPIQQQFQKLNPPCNPSIQEPVQPSKPLYNPPIEQRVQSSNPPTNPSIEHSRFCTCVPANPTFFIVPTVGTEQVRPDPNCNVPLRQNQSYNKPTGGGYLTNVPNKMETQSENPTLDPQRYETPRQGWSPPPQNCNYYADQPRTQGICC